MRNPIVTAVMGVISRFHEFMISVYLMNLINSMTFIPLIKIMNFMINGHSFMSIYVAYSASVICWNAIFSSSLLPIFRTCVKALFLLSRNMSPFTQICLARPN